MMTRDAKIGLLVGLAFILVVGILLSEHITSATAPQQASLAQAGDRVRQAVGAPVAPGPVIATPHIDANPLPRQAVVTRDQLDAPPPLPPTAHIELGQPQTGHIKVIRVDAAAPTAHDPIANAVEVGQPRQEAPMLAATTHRVNDLNLQDAAREQGLELVNAGEGTPVAPSEPRRPTLPPIANGSKVKEYVAQTGDSLSRIAARQLGKDTPANRQAIIALNPSLQRDSNRILVGVKYLVPADAWAAALDVDSGVEPVAQPASAKVTPTPTTTGFTVYTVKAGDSLWKIAEREVGSANAMSKIKELNAGTLGEDGTVKVGMKLKLPKKNG